MSTRMPVVLVSLPNLPYLLGTFDTTKFRDWWRSAPFPDALQNIKKGFHIYGRSHLAIAQRTDGRWAIYRSKDYGINWERVFLASAGVVIYDLVLINFGWAIMNASDGFYETVNAGTAWTKIASLPGATAVPAFCNIGDGDILMCTDGRYIWRSTDIARHWTLVCDQYTILHPYTKNGPIYYTNLTYPCIAGANGVVFCGCGPFLSYSYDNGLTYANQYHGWELDPRIDGYVWGQPPASLVWARLGSKPEFLIKQILVTSVDGPGPLDVTFALRYDDLVPRAGQSTLFSQFFQSRIAGTIGWAPKFQQYISPTESSQLSAYDLPNTGAASKDRLVFSAQTKIDAAGNPVPSLKYSLDGGTTWIDIDITKARFGDSTGAPVYDISFLDDNFAKTTWVFGACDNSGNWSVTEQYRRQCLSYELDLKLSTIHTKNCTIDGIISKTPFVAQQIDGIFEKTALRPYQNDVLCQGSQAKSYLLDRQLQGKVSHESPVDVILSVDTPCPYQIDVGRMWKQPRKYYHLDALMRTIVGRNYSCDVVLVKNNLNSILSKMAGKIPQFLDLDVPEESEGAFDSKQETV